MTGKSRETRRLLLIYDLSSQPFSIGDILIFQEASLVLRADHGLGKVDLALVYDPARPVVPDPAFSSVDAESFLFHLSFILPAAQVNPHLGSLLLFDSHRRLEAYVADNSSSYLVWPSLEKYAARDYLFYHCFNDLFFEHFQRHGSLPAMTSRPAASAWAQRFLAQFASDSVPVTIQLRRNPANPARDADYDAWLGFFQRCKETYRAKFIVICGRQEVDPRLRDMPNVIIAKDHGTSLELDLALLEAGALHMGMASGPATIINFSTKPYCLFKWDLNLDTMTGIVQEGYRYRFYFATPLQNWIYLPETPDLLIIEFERMWAGIQDRKGAVER